MHIYIVRLFIVAHHRTVVARRFRPEVKHIRCLAVALGCRNPTALVGKNCIILCAVGTAHLGADILTGRSDFLTVDAQYHRCCILLGPVEARIILNDILIAGSYAGRSHAKILLCRH